MEKAGLYIHVPFCSGKCPYCDFFSASERHLIPHWIEAFQLECSLYQGPFSSFDSLYLGGGTPSVLSPHQLEKAMQAVNSRFPFTLDTERSIEVNPEDVTPELLQTLHALGFNRISLGIQSLDHADLQFLGRRHGVPHCLRSLESVRAQGFTNISVDLMYGLETQSPKTWLRTLKRTLEFSPEHISCYQLTVKAGTPFERLMKKGRGFPLTEEKETEFYNLTCSFLEDMGYIHYEVSNFAKGETFRCKHNSKYWGHEPYLGLGPAAHSFDGRSRWWHVRSVKRYIRAIRQGAAPIEGREILSEDQLRMERLLLGFRVCDGLPLGFLSGWRNARNVVRDLEGAGLLARRSGNLVPTRSGFLIADSLPLLFLETE